MGRKTSARWLYVWRTDGFWGALAAAAVLALGVFTGVAQRAEYRLYDTATALSTTAPSSEVTVVGIDDASLQALGPWPWPRDLHARLIDQLSAAGAKAIVYTPAFDQPQSDLGLAHVRKIREALASHADGSPLTLELDRMAGEAETALDGDARLGASIQKAGNVLLASRYTRHGAVAALAPLPPYVSRSALSDPAGEALASAQSAFHPIPALGNVAAGVGHFHMAADEDGKLRRMPLLLRHGNAAVPSLALLAAGGSPKARASDIRVQESPPAVLLGAQSIATDSSAAMLLRMNAGQSESGMPQPFASVSAGDVLAGKAPAAALRNKVVLVGEASPALAQPLRGIGEHMLYPVEWLAQTVATIRQGLGVEAPAWGPAASWCAAALALAFAALVAPRLSWALALGNGAALALGFVMVEWVLLRYAGQWVPLQAAVIGLAGGVLAVALRKGGAAKPATRRPPAEAVETDRMMGLVLHGQGQLEMAFERLCKAPPDEALMDNFYHLAQDFERKRNHAKAMEVYGQILRHSPQYRDARTHFNRLKAKVQDSEAPISQPPADASANPVSRPHGDAAPGMPALGRYRIDKEIGKGAMGTVYLGKDPKIGRVVAIKTLALSQEFEGEALADARARFFREAETAGRLQHPHIVTIFDAGEDHDLAYIAMEFLKGENLSHFCNKEHLLPTPSVLSIAARVADALDYAHANQIVHRDIKPANIMFDAAADSVKVTDFGIARITDSSKTRTGLVLGTPSFMSPEQLAGKKVDGRSDLYSLGVMLFQLLTGSLPLRGESMTDLMHKIANVQPPDVRQLRPELPAAVAQVVATALKKQPEARYQTGRQVAAELRQAAAGIAGPTAGQPPQAVVYDAKRDAAGHEMADFQETVMEPEVLDAPSFRPFPKPDDARRNLHEL